MPLPLVILGAGGFAHETLDVIDAINEKSPTWDMVGFLVDPEFGTPGTIITNKPILGSIELLQDHPDTYVICGIGAPELRYKMIQRVAAFSAHFATVIHPSVLKTRWLTIGEGTVITAGCILSSNIKEEMPRQNERSRQQWKNRVVCKP